METKESNEFAEKYLNKMVRYKGGHWGIPLKDYKVTAALYKYEEGNVTIFAVMSPDWHPPDNLEWFTIKLNENELQHLELFEIL